MRVREFRILVKSLKQQIIRGSGLPAYSVRVSSYLKIIEGSLWDYLRKDSNDPSHESTSILGTLQFDIRQ